MNAARITIAAAAAAALVIFALAPVNLAQHGDASGRPAMGPMAQHMIAHMHRMAKIKSHLEQAKGAAEAEGDKVAAAHIDEALKLLAEDHRAIHEHMAQMKKMMKERMERMRATEHRHHEMREHGGKESSSERHPKMDSDPKEADATCPICQRKMSAEPKVVNTRCPITGAKVDPFNVPDALTRQFEGKKVGFCCPGCLTTWDKLSDQQKREKLRAVMPKPDGE